MKVNKIVFKDQDGKDVNVETTQFMGFRGLILQSKITKLMTPLISILKGIETPSLKGIKKSNILFDTNDLVNHLCKNLDDNIIIDLIKELVASTTIDNKDLSNSDIFDIIFAGNYDLLFKTIRFIIDTNNFFGKGGIGKIITKINSMLPEE
jgi:hypothetical protein